MSKFGYIFLVLLVLSLNCSTRFTTLKIDIVPKNATINFDGKDYRDNNPLMLSNVEFGEYTLHISCETYFPLDTILIVQNSDTHACSFKLLRKSGFLQINTLPEQAVISIYSTDNYKLIVKKLSPAKFELIPGEYRVILSKGSTYLLKIIDIEIESGKTISLNDIILSDKCETLRITTNPESLFVVLNGSLQRGQTPIILKNVNLGKYKIRIEHPNILIKPLESEIMLCTQDTLIHFNIQDTYSMIDIKSEPQKARVEIKYLDKRNNGIEMPTPNIFYLPPGGYSISVSKFPFFKQIVEELYIGKRDSICKNYYLEPLEYLKEMFVQIPENKICIGNENGNMDEKPVHTVLISEYWMSKNEVTRDEFNKFLMEIDQNNPYYEEGNELSNPQFKNHPAIFVSWFEAKAYTKWLSKKIGVECRLPTEAEWEKAARGPNASVYPWGNSWQNGIANFCDKRCARMWRNEHIDDGYATTAPAGSFSGDVSYYGIYDMGGNVSEWCEDSYDETYYNNSPTKDPICRNESGYRVVRGGSWEDFPERLESSLRSRNHSARRSGKIGFRIVIPSQQEKPDAANISNNY